MKKNIWPPWILKCTVFHPFTPSKTQHKNSSRGMFLLHYLDFSLEQQNFFRTLFFVFCNLNYVFASNKRYFIETMYFVQTKLVAAVQILYCHGYGMVWYIVWYVCIVYQTILPEYKNTTLENLSGIMIFMIKLNKSKCLTNDVDNVGHQKQKKTQKTDGIGCSCCSSMERRRSVVYCAKHTYTHRTRAAFKIE